MRKRTRGFAVLGVLVVAGWLCAGVAAAAAPSINVGIANGSAGGTATVEVTLNSGTATVAGTMNDIGFDSHTPIAVASGGRCLITTSTSCTSDADCPPLLPSPYTGNEPCVDRTGQPDCTVNSAIGKQAFFSFQPITPGTPPVPCVPGTSCTGIRALIFAANQKDPTAIPDGSALYSCNVSIAAGTLDGDYPLTISNVGMGDTSHPSNPVADATGVPGNVHVGPPEGFLVCDVAPSTGNSAGQFGNGTITNTDVVAIFKASLTTPPPAGTALFSAMDAAPVDAPPTCGGNTSVVNTDVVACFKTSLLPTAPKYRRTLSGGTCTSAQQ